MGTVAAGDPFVLVNARRLRFIAWALLAIQLLDLGFGVLEVSIATRTGERLGWAPSVTAWLAVVLLFVLARVFEAGATLREELAGTV